MEMFALLLFHSVLYHLNCTLIFFPNVNKTCNIWNVNLLPCLLHFYKVKYYKTEAKGSFHFKTSVTIQIDHCTLLIFILIFSCSWTGYLYFIYSSTLLCHAEDWTQRLHGLGKGSPAELQLQPHITNSFLPFWFLTFYSLSLASIFIWLKNSL